MLPKNQRVSRAIFSEVARRGKSVHSAHFSLKAVKVEDGQPPRFSFVVSKKVAALATTRNLLRRRLAAALTGLLPSLPQGLAGIFYAKAGAAGLAFTIIQEEVRFLVKNLK